MRHRRKRIEKSITKVNTTPSRVDISDSTADPTAVIHRIPLKWYAEDLLRNFWFWSTGGLLCIFFGLPFGCIFISIYLNLPDGPVWIGIPMMLLLLHALLLLRFVHMYRPIRIRIHAGTFYFDSWNGKQ